MDVFYCCYSVHVRDFLTENNIRYKLVALYQEYLLGLYLR